jgi:hypothetical protein
MSEFSKVAAELESVRTAIDAPPPTDFRTKGGHDLKKAEAKLALPGVTKKFLNAFKQVGFTVTAVGEGAEKYANAVSKVTDSVSVDFGKVFGTVHEMVRATMGHGQEFGPNQYSVLSRELRQVAVDNGIQSIPLPQFKGNTYVGTDREALAKVVNEYIEAATGTEISGPAVESTAAQLAEKLRTENPVVPVVVFNITREAAEKVGPRTFQKKYLLVEVPSDFDDEFVINSLKEVKKLVKSKDN